MFPTTLVFVTLVSSLLVSAEFTEEQIELMNNLHAECVSQTGVSEDLILKARKGDFADDQNLKCYIKCIFDEIGVIDDDGKLDVEGVIVMLPDEMKGEAGAAFKKCGTITGADICESIWLTHKCYFAEAPGSYFLP